MPGRETAPAPALSQLFSLFSQRWWPPTYTVLVSAATLSIESQPV